MTCAVSTDLGGYVLHALDEQDQRAVEQHLIECDECLAEVGRLATVVALLALVPAAEAERIERGVAAARSQVAGRRRARRTAALVAAAAVLGGGVATARVVAAPHPPPQAVALHGVGPGSHTDADITMTAQGAGTAFRLSLTGAPLHGWCSLVARATDGRREVAATWPADSSGRVVVNGTTAIDPQHLTALSVVTDTGRRLVTLAVPHPQE